MGLPFGEIADMNRMRIPERAMQRKVGEMP
jgi:hypothetical protein